MERVKDYLHMLGRHIINEIDDHEDEDDIERITELCEDYNEVYKFYCHHKMLKDGADPRYAHEGMTHAAVAVR